MPVVNWPFCHIPTTCALQKRIINIKNCSVLYFSFAVASAIKLWNRFIFEDHEHEKFAPLIQKLFNGCVQKPGETYYQFLINLRQVCKYFNYGEPRERCLWYCYRSPRTKSHKTVIGAYMWQWWLVQILWHMPYVFSSFYCLMNCYSDICHLLISGVGVNIATNILCESDGCHSKSLKIICES